MTGGDGPPDGGHRHRFSWHTAEPGSERVVGLVVHRQAAGVEGEGAACVEQLRQPAAAALHPRLHPRDRDAFAAGGVGLRHARPGRSFRRRGVAPVAARAAAGASSATAPRAPGRVVRPRPRLRPGVLRGEPAGCSRARPARRYSSMTALRAMRDTQCGRRSRSSSEARFRWIRRRISPTRSSARSGSAIRGRTNARSCAMTSRHIRSDGACSVNDELAVSIFSRYPSTGSGRPRSY